MIECPGCHVKLPDRHLDPPDRTNASGECGQVYSDLMCYTVAKQDPEFIHQHVVDTYAAQHAGGPTRNITVAFGLIGLYLALEKGYTGKQVQQAHMRIAKAQKVWPRSGAAFGAGSPDGHGCAPGRDRWGERCHDQEMDGGGLGELVRPPRMDPDDD